MMNETKNESAPKIGDEVIFNDYYANLNGTKGKIIAVNQHGQYKISYINSDGVPKRVNTSTNSFEVIEL